MRKFLSSPYFRIFISFLGLVMIGTILLVLPISTKDRNGLDFMDALFTATSSVCITGLTVVSNYGEQFSAFGKVVIALLMETGGLSILTLTVFIVVLLGRKVGIADRFLMKEALNQNSATGIVRLVITIVIATLSIQLAGAVLSFISISRYYPAGEAVGLSLFHSISSFNNAGIDIFGYDDSLYMFREDVFFNITTMLLIILGGLGFVVLKDLFSGKKPRDLMLITKIVIPCTVILIVGGMLLLKLAIGVEITWLQALFQSVSSRTAGFSVYDLSDPNNAEYTTLILLMITGGAPCSTAGGLKITTIFVIFLALFYYSRGKTPHVFNRRISEKTVFKAFSLVVSVTIYLALMVLLLTFLEPEQRLNQLIFELISAISNSGLSTGISAQLGVGGKLILIISMFIGRVGPMTFLNILNNRWMTESGDNIKFVEEKVIIG